jgi:phosphatidate cytidylyltransferase
MDDDELLPFRGEPRQPDTEGVRIIGAEEAEKAIEREDVAHRLPTDAPRFGDRPVSPPEDGPRPAIRFPLAGSSDPRDVERTPIVPADPPSMPHWTEPATGEVPAIFAAESGSGTGSEDDLEAWSSFTSSQPRWRGEGGAAEQDDYDDFSRLADDDTRIGALDTSDRPGPDDFFEFDEAYDEPVIDPEPETRSISSDPRRTGARTRSTSSAYDRPTDGGRDVQQAAVVGAGIAAAYLLLSSLGSQAVMVLVVAVIGFAVAELFTALRKGGYHPATLLGIVASVTLPIAAYAKLEAAYPVVLFMTVVFCLIWYLIGAGGEDSPVLGTASTLLGVGYVGVLGSFAALILALPNEQGVGVLFGAVFATVGYDVGGFFVGRSLGSRPLSAASPNKTVEGLLGGALGAIILGGIFAGFIGPWSDKGLGVHLLFGVCAAVAAFLGDLCESLLKRDLGVKDMGTILPGHGGVLDRFDAMLFVLPATYYVALIFVF